jgi:hypothetical protein
LRTLRRFGEGPDGRQEPVPCYLTGRLVWWYEFESCDPRGVIPLRLQKHAACGANGDGIQASACGSTAFMKRCRTGGSREGTRIRRRPGLVRGGRI